ncbi:MAG: hypothetical protein H7336_11910 [Bacteriovorax sp.]|nr:hypothetical protein [Bacteriovorax sp.]
MTETTTIEPVEAQASFPPPPRPPKSFRIVLNLNYRETRMDNVLLKALHEQDENASLKIISRGALKDLFTKSKIEIKGQRAKSSSAINKGLTYVDILGY